MRRRKKYLFDYSILSPYEKEMYKDFRRIWEYFWKPVYEKMKLFRMKMFIKKLFKIGE